MFHAERIVLTSDKSNLYTIKSIRMLSNLLLEYPISIAFPLLILSIVLEMNCNCLENQKSYKYIANRCVYSLGLLVVIGTDDDVDELSLWAFDAPIN